MRRSAEAKVIVELNMKSFGSNFKKLHYLVVGDSKPTK